MIIHGLRTPNEGINQSNLKIGAMWQTKYALAVPKNLGVGVDFLPFILVIKTLEVGHFNIQFWQPSCKSISLQLSLVDNCLGFYIFLSNIWVNIGTNLTQFQV